MALHAFEFSLNTDMLSPKSRKRNQKIKKIIADFPFFSVSVCADFLPLVSRLCQSDHSMFGTC